MAGLEPIGAFIQGLLEAVLIFMRVAYGEYGYPIVLAASFLENTTLTSFIFPGGTMVLLGGVYAREGLLSLPGVIVCGALGTMLGTSLDFGIGVASRKGLLRRWTEKPRFRGGADFARVWFARHGPKIMLVAHFAGLVRSVAALGAGLSGFPYRRFILYEAPAAILWNIIFSLVGYLVADSLRQAELSSWIVPAIGAAAVALYFVFQYVTRLIRRKAGLTESSLDG